MNANEIIESRGLVGTFTMCLDEIESRVLQIIADSREIETRRELSKEEAVVIKQRLEGAMFDRQMYMHALEQSRIFEEIKSSDGRILQ